MIPWILRMAWRDSRRQRAKLLLFGFSMAFGVAALAALGSLRKNLQTSIEEQSRALLGADLVLSSREPFDPAQEAMIRSLGGIQSRETRFSSMLYFEATGRSHLVQARMVTGDFPFYGRFETTPPAAESEFAAGRGALVDQALLLQFGAKPGGSILVGDMRLRIAGGLEKAPGDSPVSSLIAPRVYLKRSALAAQPDLKPGGFANYRVFFRFPVERNVDELLRDTQESFDRLRFEVDTVARRKEQLGRAFDEMDNFMSLISLIALALGGLGISSALSVHLREKRSTAAVLRCLGCSFRQVAGIYLSQGLALGAAGVAAGLVMGLAAQAALPSVLAGFLPVQVRFAIEWLALLQAAGCGMGLAAAFGLLPLLEIRTATPLAAIRRPFESDPEPAWDAARIMVWLLIAGALTAFCLLHTRRWTLGLGMACGLMVVLAVLTGIARALVWGARRLNFRRLPFVLRQGLANLHRPRNRTLLLTVVLGTSTALFLTTGLIRSSFLAAFQADGLVGRGNTILMDVQSDQVGAVTGLLWEKGFPLVDHAPIVTMRLASVKGASAESLRAHLQSRRQGWRQPPREFRSSYAAGLRKGEKLTAGQWPPVWNTNDAVVPVSLAEWLARSLGVHLGDELGFDIQGIPIKARVAAVRKVEWWVRADFPVIFPPGAIDDAPAFHVFMTRSESAEQSAALQKAVILGFPNVSVLDLRTVLAVVESIIAKAEQTVRFVAGFTVLTVVMVLAGALATSRTQRVRETALLRALGASKRQLRQILAVEYAALGVLASASGAALSVASAWALCHFVFEFRFTPDWTPLPFVLIGVALLAVIVGLSGSGRILRHPPLEVLRSEE